MEWSGRCSVQQSSADIPNNASQAVACGEGWPKVRIGGGLWGDVLTRIVVNLPGHCFLLSLFSVNRSFK